MSVPTMNGYNGGQNFYNWLPGGYYNPTGASKVPGISDPALQGFVNQMMNLFTEGGGLSDAEAMWRDNWLREHGHGYLFPQQAAPAPAPVQGTKPGYYLGPGSTWSRPPSQPMPPGANLPPQAGPYVPQAPLPGTPATSIADLQARNNMGPNFGGAMPGAGGVGSYGPPPINWNLRPDQTMKTTFGPETLPQSQGGFLPDVPQRPRFGFGGGSAYMARRPRPMMSPLTGLSQRLLQSTMGQRPPSQPMGWMGRANSTWG